MTMTLRQLRNIFDLFYSSDLVDRTRAWDALAAAIAPGVKCWEEPFNFELSKEEWHATLDRTVTPHARTATDG